ncbi:MAG: chorismate-binding protein [Leptothrix sp. (in: b-proteobacteria)]
MHAAFALLDDDSASAAAPTSRLYRGFVREHRCTDPLTLDATCAQVDADLGAGLHAVLLADYEWGVRLQGANRHQPLADDAGALSVLMFEACDRLDRAAVDAWLAEKDAADGPAGFATLTPQVDEGAFAEAIGQIHQFIRAGETYQVNYTYRLHGEAWGDPVALYRRLRMRQPVPYGALIHLPDARWVLSCSPELFLRHQQGLLTTKPMKGTAARQPQPQTQLQTQPQAEQARADAATATWLHDDVKNRAENLMIVDLLRNDLGRIARTGSVKVPALFTVEGYRTVFQMTSTVTAELPAETRLPAVLRALFPCGSITGAPKHHTMGLIAALENTPRGLYTGAIGWLDAPRGAAPRALGDFCFNVAIRTATLQAPHAHADGGRRLATLGVGAGIVLDSVAESEAEECRVKLRFVTALDPGFTLFETLRAEGGQLLRLEAHLARLSRSALALGFRFDEPAARQALADALNASAPHAGAVLRVRLDLAFDGRCQARCAPLAPLAEGPVGLLIAEAALPANEVALLGHKTSLRSGYDRAIAQAEAAGAFDSLFMDAADHLTEGARSNLLVRLDGQWWTPRLSGHLLPGVMRAAVLSGAVRVGDGDGADQPPREADLTRSELLRADALAVCNSLRGVLPARLIG